MSCHEVKASNDTGLPQYFVSTTPLAIDSAPANPATVPTVSSRAPARRTRSATPAIPSRPREYDPRRESLAKQPSCKCRRNQWLDRSEGYSYSARKSIGGHEQQRKEAADVERAEDQCLDPPCADRAPPSERCQQQPGGKGPQRTGEQRPPGRQQFGRDDVCHAPRGRRQHGRSEKAEAGGWVRMNGRCAADDSGSRRDIRDHGVSLWIRRHPARPLHVRQRPTIAKCEPSSTKP